MRRPLVLATALVTAACARTDTPASPARPEEPPAPRAAAAVAKTAETPPAPRAPAPSDAPQGHLAHPGRLGTFFQALAELEAHRGSHDVRVVQLGDSHTASDYLTGALRTHLAKRFGDGGRGVLGIGEPHRRQFQTGESMARSFGFEPLETPGGPPGRVRRDTFVGLSGVAVEARAAGSRASSDLTASADSVEVAYLAQPGGGSFEVLVDGKVLGNASTASETRKAGFASMPVSRGNHQLEVRLTGNGPVRLFGVRLDDETVGTTWDALGMNGAEASALLATDHDLLASALAHLEPALVVLAYGTNEAGNVNLTAESHGASIGALAGLVRRAAPGAACLLLGPPDHGVAPATKLAAVVEAQRRAADEAGCAFFDQLAAMGGAGAIKQWARSSPPRARRDLVHLNRAGYAEVADLVMADLLAAYDRSQR